MSVLSIAVPPALGTMPGIVTAQSVFVIQMIDE